MAIEITIPRLGWSMEEGSFVGWLKQDGDRVRAGEPLFSLEGEKATQDIESIDEGTLYVPPGSPMAGETVAVGSIIGFLLNDGEPAPEYRFHAGLTEQKSEVLAARGVLESVSIARKPRSSPLARRIAREHGIDWTQLRGSGTSGRIRKADVLEAVKARLRGQLTLNDQSNTVVPLTMMRRTIAARMVKSHSQTAPVTLTTTVDATNLVGLRDQFKAMDTSAGAVPSYLDFIVKLTALALLDYPLMNAQWNEKTGEIIFPGDVAIGIAVDTEAGLMVPVIRGAAGLGLREIATRSRELIQSANERRLIPEDLQGGTFTITNLGAFGIETFTPMINLPECAILGLGRISRRPVMDGEKVVGRELMFLSLTFDHRIVDGAPAARFLQHLGRFIETPGPSLIS
jgi:pyruvate dehydrogenase E2 component (dihydrolipoyllysine-residue acetyltransferase)